MLSNNKSSYNTIILVIVLTMSLSYTAYKMLRQVYDYLNLNLNPEVYVRPL